MSNVNSDVKKEVGMDIELVRSLALKNKIAIKKHCLLRMHQRGFGFSDIKAALTDSVIVREYDDDGPLASALVLGFSSGRPIHAVVAPEGNDLLWIITAYEPDLDIWMPGYLKKRGN